MNVVALVGNIASAPELRHTAKERPVCTFRLAVSRVGVEQADFFTVVAWERQAEICAEYLTVGRRVAVEGRLHHSTWEQDGTKRSKVEIIAHRVELLGPRPRTDDEPRTNSLDGADDREDGDAFPVAASTQPQPAFA